MRPRLPDEDWTVRLPVLCAVSDKLEFLVRFLNKCIQDGDQKLWFSDEKGRDSVFTFEYCDYPEYRDDMLRPGVPTMFVNLPLEPATPNFPYSAIDGFIIETKKLETPKKGKKIRNKKVSFKDQSGIRVEEEESVHSV